MVTLSSGRSGNMKKLFCKDNFFCSSLEKKQAKQFIIVKCLVALLYIVAAFTFMNMFYWFVDMVGSIVSGSADVALKDFARSAPIFLVFFMTLWSLLCVHAYYRNASEERRRKSLKKNAIVVGCLWEGGTDAIKASCYPNLCSVVEGGCW